MLGKISCGIGAYLLALVLFGVFRFFDKAIALDGTKIREAFFFAGVYYLFAQVKTIKKNGYFV